jgi:hypothetical protein
MKTSKTSNLIKHPFADEIDDGENACFQYYTRKFLSENPHYSKKQLEDTLFSPIGKTYYRALMLLGDIYGAGGILREFCFSHLYNTMKDYEEIKLL